MWQFRTSKLPLMRKLAQRVVLRHTNSRKCDRKTLGCATPNTVLKVCANSQNYQDKKYKKPYSGDDMRALGYSGADISMIH